jgi:hypothetical protein
LVAGLLRAGACRQAQKEHRHQDRMAKPPHFARPTGWLLSSTMGKLRHARRPTIIDSAPRVSQVFSCHCQQRAASGQELREASAEV